MNKQWTINEQSMQIRENRWTIDENPWTINENPWTINEQSMNIYKNLWTIYEIVRYRDTPPADPFHPRRPPPTNITPNKHTDYLVTISRLSRDYLRGAWWGRGSTLVAFSSSCFQRNPYARIVIGTKSDNGWLPKIPRMLRILRVSIILG